MNAHTIKALNRAQTPNNWGTPKSFNTAVSPTGCAFVKGYAAVWCDAKAKAA